ncbi:MFS transporter [Cytobacillus depressus]|uniref:MFS transporter n=1 Tax=Cytobacillus depressus TaxID=1602942 RepID=A0A6L3V3T7_9BACI|nr:MFS transporter [Cytobacillus depressus]KAB2332312.1 MFS transporter [Cytobacillus depressus]
MHYGWIVVGLTFFTILIAAGIRSITGVLIIPLEQEFEWSRSAISFAFAINLTIYGFSGPFIAAGLERIGIRKTMVYSMILLVIGMIASLFMTHIWHLNLIWGIMIGVASGVFLTVLSATVANNWFEKRKGIVVGILMAATAAGQMIFLPLLSNLTEAFSWRTGIYVFIVLGILMIPIIAIWMRDKPAERGLLPYGAAASQASPIIANKKNPIKEAFEVLWIGVRTVPFWLLSISFFICGLSTAGLIGTHFIAACGLYGISEVYAAGLFAFMGVFNIIGTMIAGWLSDRFDNRWLLFWFYSLRGLSLIILPFALDLRSYPMLVAFSVFYGLDWIATVPPTIRLASEYFGKERGAIIYGWVFAAHQVGSGVAAFLGGYFYEVFNGYSITFISAGALCIVATFFVLKFKKKQVVIENGIGI